MLEKLRRVVDGAALVGNEHIMPHNGDFVCGDDE